MLVSRSLRGFLGCTLALHGLGVALPAPALAQEARVARAPIEFRLHAPAASASSEVDIWAPADPRIILEAQSEITALRQSVGPPADARHSFGGMLLGAVTALPVIGQFANHEWMKGTLALVTAAGLTTAIVLGNDRGDAQLVRLGTLGLYPLAIYGTVDALVTRQQRATPATPRP